MVQKLRRTAAIVARGTFKLCPLIHPHQFCQASENNIPRHHTPRSTFWATRFVPVLISLLRKYRPRGFQILFRHAQDETLANSRRPVSPQNQSRPVCIDSRRRKNRLCIAHSPDVLKRPHRKQRIARLIGGRWSTFRLFSRLQAITRRLRQKIFRLLNLTLLNQQIDIVKPLPKPVHGICVRAKYLTVNPLCRQNAGIQLCFGSAPVSDHFYPPGRDRSAAAPGDSARIGTGFAHRQFGCYQKPRDEISHLAIRPAYTPPNTPPSR
jgi:hypothetical protein